MSGIRMNRQAKGAAPTLISATQANILIDFYNAMQAATVSPMGSGSFVFASDKIILDLSQLIASLQAQIQTLQGEVDAVTSQLSATTYAIANATIVCNPDSTITITFPGIDPQ